MTQPEYFQLVQDTAQTYVDGLDIDGTTRPSTALQEMVDGLIDRNWTEDDAAACLKFSDYPSAEQFNTGGYKPSSPQDPFPFKAFASPSFLADVVARIGEIGFSLLDAEDEWELTHIQR